MPIRQPAVTLAAGQAIVGNSSCTTNCMAPVAKLLTETWGIRAAL